ncbi:MAG: hypothetical protein AVDCRST_MAG52-1625, partial [uncultured Blastococcus sp.]
ADRPLDAGSPPGGAVRRQRRPVPVLGALAHAPRQSGGVAERGGGAGSGRRCGAVAPPEPVARLGGARRGRARQRDHRAARLAVGHRGGGGRARTRADRRRPLRGALLRPDRGPVPRRAPGPPVHGRGDRRPSRAVHRGLGRGRRLGVRLHRGAGTPGADAPDRGDDRPADRGGQPPRLGGGDGSPPGPGGAHGRAAQRGDPRPRRLQAGQRPARARSRRRPAPRADLRLVPPAAPGRPARPLRRRRVRRLPTGDRRCRSAGDPAAARGHARVRVVGRGGHPPGRRRPGRAARASRRRPLPAQAQRPDRL